MYHADLPRALVILTDRAVRIGTRFDPESIDRFIAEHADDDLSTDVILIAEKWDENCVPLLDFVRSRGGVTIVGLSMTKTIGFDDVAFEIGHLLRHDFERAVVLDPRYKSAGPRITVHRRITR